MFRTLILSLLLGLPLSAAHAEEPLTLCHEGRDSYPWVLRDGGGLNLELLTQVAEALQLRLQLVAVPWKRCLAGLEDGHYDGAFAASFKAERLAMGRYPTTAEGDLDVSKRLHLSLYALYRRRGDQLDWDGQRLLGLQGRIGSLSGFSIVDFLRQHGAEVDETSRDPLELLHMLRVGRVQGVALQAPRADQLLSQHAELAAGVEKIALPLEQKPYFLMLSHALVAERPALAAALWSEIERQRDSASYQLREMEFFRQR